MRHPLSEARTVVLICLLLVGLVALVFGQGAWFPFNELDDPQWVSANPAVQTGLSLEGVRYAFGSTIVGHWAPLTVLSHMAAWHAFGSNAGTHHLVNVGLHATGAVLLFLALRSLTGALWQSAVVAALFAVHPLRVESVMWITERKDVLSGVFFFLTLWAYGRWTRRRGFGRYLLVLALAACGLMSKSMLVTLPFVLLLLDVWPLRRLHGKGEAPWRVAEKLPFVVLSLGMAILQYRLVEPVMVTVSEIGWDGRIGNAVMSYAVYAGQLFWPASLAVFYPHPGAPSAGQLIASSAALLSITAAVWWYGRKSHFLWVGWLWYLGMLFPVIDLVQCGDIARADRYTYLPQIGLLIMCLWGIEKVSRSWRHRPWLLGSAAGIALVAAAIAGWAQAGTWRDEQTLWSNALAYTEGNYRACHSLGMAEANRKNFPAAINRFREAARLNPTGWRPPNNLAMVLLETGDIEAALQAATTAARMNPDQTALAFGRAFKDRGRLQAAAWFFQQALTARPADVEAELELAFVLGRLGVLAESERAYRSVLKRFPDRMEALVELGMFFLQAGQIDEAIPLLERALQQVPDESRLLTALANARLMQGRSSLAVSLYRTALERHPHSIELQAQLSWQLATSADDSLRNGREAVQWAQRAVAGSGGTDPSILRILAAAHAEAGEFPEAIAAIGQAVTIAQQRGDADLTVRLEAQRAFHRRNEPLRVPIRSPGR